MSVDNQQKQSQNPGFLLSDLYRQFSRDELEIRGKFELLFDNCIKLASDNEKLNKQIRSLLEEKAKLLKDNNSAKRQDQPSVSKRQETPRQ